MLRDRYDNNVIETISIALPVWNRAVPANTRSKSGYAIAAASDEFFVKFIYWLVVGGIIILSACGITTNFNTWFGVNPIEAAASFWPLLTPWTPALTHSAIKVAVYKDKANARDINSGGNFRPPLKVKDVFDNCSITVSYTHLTLPTKA